MGNVYFANKEYEKAKEWYEKLVNIAIYDISSYEKLGDANYKLKDYKSAVKNYVKFCNINGLCFKLGRAYYLDKQYDKAIEVYDQLIEQVYQQNGKKRNKISSDNKYESNIISKRKKELMLKQERENRELEKKIAGLYYNRAEVYVKKAELENIDKAIEYYVQAKLNYANAVKKDSKFKKKKDIDNALFLLYFEKGDLLNDKKNMKEALEEYGKGVKLDLEDNSIKKDMYKKIADIHYSNASYSNALKYYKEALNLGCVEKELYENYLTI